MNYELNRKIQRRKIHNSKLTLALLLLVLGVAANDPDNTATLDDSALGATRLN